jgi:hypothetical protein
VGADSPSENIIATIVASLGSLSLPLLLPFSHRFGRRALFRGVLSMSIVTVILMGVFAMKPPFDAMHQRRLFVLHLENVSFSFSLLLVEVLSSSLNLVFIFIGYHE